MSELTLFQRLYENPQDTTKIFYDSDIAFAMLSVTPATPGAYMVIPKKPVVKATDLSNEEIGGVIRACDESFQELRRQYSYLHLAHFYKSIADNPPPGVDSAKAADARRDLSIGNFPHDYNIGVNTGQISGQTIPHWHVHVMPRRGCGQDRGGAVNAFHMLLSGENL